MLYNLKFNMLYNTCYITHVITFPELLYNIQVWLYNIQDGYTTHPNLPDVESSPGLEQHSTPGAGWTKVRTILNRCSDNFRLLRRCGIRRLSILEF